MLLFAATAVNAQTIVKGDMNDDNDLTIADAVSLVDVILGKSPMQTISLGGDPFKVDNALVVGTWYAPEGWSFTLSDDGTTDYPGAASYEFMPMTGRLLFLQLGQVSALRRGKQVQRRQQYAQHQADDEYEFDILLHFHNLISFLPMRCACRRRWRNRVSSPGSACHRCRTRR